MDEMHWRKEKQKRKRAERRDPNKQVVDVSTMFPALDRLAITLTNLLDREGMRVLPGTAVADFAMTLRQLRQTFNLLLFVGSDDTRDGPSFQPAYLAVMRPLIRTMVDGFYNTTAILDNPARATAFRLSGFRKMLEDYGALKRAYGRKPEWSEYLRLRREQIATGLRADGFTKKQAMESEWWPLLGRYVDTKPRTPHKRLLGLFMHGPWREYSEISHVTFAGLESIAPVLMRDIAPHQLRERILDSVESELAFHIFRAAAVLLALLTELQAFFRFRGHHVNQRLHALWRDMQVVPEVRELLRRPDEVPGPRRRTHRPIRPVAGCTPSIPFRAQLRPRPCPVRV